MKKVKRASSRRGKPVSGLVLVFGICVLWQLSVSGGWVQSDNWPALSTVLSRVVNGFVTGEWPTVFMPSFGRMLSGYLIGCVVGIAVGAVVAASSLMRQLLGASIALLRPLPVPAIIPPLILLLGVDNTLKVTVIAFGVFFPVFMSAQAGVMATDPLHRQVARTFRVSPWRELWYVRLPAALPYIFSGMRTSLGLALILTVIAEMTSGGDGVGYYIMSMQYAMRAADLYAAVILLSFSGYALNRFFVQMEGHALRWARQQEEM